MKVGCVVGGALRDKQCEGEGGPSTGTSPSTGSNRCV